MNEGSGGLGAISVGISELLVIGALVVLIAFVGWQLVKLLIIAGK